MIEAVVLDAAQGVVVSAPYTDRLLIMGGAPSSKGWPKPGWDGEVWTPNFLRAFPQRISTNNGHEPVVFCTTRLFQMHPPEILLGNELAHFEHSPVPVYTLKDESRRNSQAVVYPFERVCDTVGRGPFSSSFDYMIALALADGFSHLTIAGVDLQHGTPRERLAEHVSCAHWIGVARGRGVTVNVQGRVLGAPYRYGYDFQAERTWGQRMAFWAVLGALNFQFDDGGAKTAVRGWSSEFSAKRVRIGI